MKPAAAEMKEDPADMVITAIKGIRNFSSAAGMIIATTTGMKTAMTEMTGTVAENSIKKDSNNFSLKQFNPDGASPSGFYFPQLLTFTNRAHKK